MNKSLLTETGVESAGNVTGRTFTGRRVLIAIIATLAMLVAAPVAAEANVGLGASSGNRTGDSANPLDFGTGPQLNLPRQITVWLYNDNNTFLSAQASSNVFTMTGSAYRRNGGTCNGTATGQSWTSTISGTSGITGSGNSCSIILELQSGTAPGTHAGTLSFTSNRAIEGTNPKTLTGVVQANTWTGDYRDTANANTLSTRDFGSQPVTNSSSPYTFVFRNTGNLPLTGTNNVTLSGANSADFSRSTTCGASLAVGANCQITVTFTPTGVGARAASLNVVTNEGGTISLPITGTGLTPTFIPEIQNTAGTAAEPTHSFPTTPTGEGQYPTYTFTLRNVGNAPLTGANIQALSGPDAGDFVRSTNCPATLQPNATCTITTGFFPQSVGSKTATLEVNTTNGGSATTALDGTAIAGIQETTIQNTAGDTPLVSHTFPDILATTTTSYTFTLRNTGNTNLSSLSTQSITGDDADQFSRSSTCGATLAPNAVCNITVTYAPTRVEAGMTASLNVNPSNGGSSSIPLNATSTTPSPVVSIRDTGNTVDLTTRDFGNVNIGSSGNYVFTIRNSGDAPITNVAGSQSVNGSNASEFSRATSCGATLAPGATCTVTITFSPTRAGLRTARLNIAPANSAVTPAPKSVQLTGNGSGLMIMNDVTDNLQNLPATSFQKRWLETGTVNPGGSQPADIVRVAFEVDAGLATSIEGVQIAGSTTTNLTPPGSGFQNITDLLGGQVTVERKAGSAQALVTAAVPLSVTNMGIGNGQYGFSNGTDLLCAIGIMGGSMKTDNRHVWFRVTGSGGATSAPVGSAIRFVSQNYGCPNNQGPGMIAQKITAIGGVAQPNNTITAVAPKNETISLSFQTRTKTDGAIVGDAGNAYAINWRIRNLKTGDMYRISGGSYQPCGDPCTADGEFNNGARVNFASDLPGVQTMDIPGIPSRGRWVIEGSIKGTQEDLNRFYHLGTVRINDPAQSSPTATFGGTLGARPDTDEDYTIVANVSDPADPVNTLDSQGGKVQVIEWDLDGDPDNGPLSDGFEYRAEGDSTSGVPSPELTQAFSTVGKTPGPYQIRARITDNGSLLASEVVAQTRIFEFNTTINSLPQPENDIIYLEADQAQPTDLDFRVTDVDNDPYRVEITPAGTNDGSLGGNLNGPIGDNTKPYTWPAAYTGTDTFDFVPTDDKKGEGPQGTLTVRVRPNTTIDTSTIAGTLFNPDVSNVNTRFLGSTTDTSAEFDFSSPQTPVVSYECRHLLDGDVLEDWDECSDQSTGEISYSDLGDGLHRVEIRALNDEGVEDGTPAFRTWRVDNTAPLTEVRIGPPSNLPNQQPRFTNDTTPSYIFRATADERSLQQYMTYECRVMWGPSAEQWLPCGAPSDSQGSALVDIVNGNNPDFGIDDPLPEGVYSIEVRATDEVGNLGPVMLEQVQIDTTAPETALASGPEGLVNTRNLEYVLGSSQGQSTFLCQVEGVNEGIVVPMGPCPGPAADGSRPTFTVPADDIYTLTAIAVDPADNADPTPLEVEFEVDATEPTTSMDPQVNYGDGPTTVRRTQSRKVDVTFTGSDIRQLQGFQCRLDSTDDEDWELCQSVQRFSGLSDGDHKLEIRAKDEAGNFDSTPEVLEWTVDLTPPVSEFTVSPDPITNDANPAFEFETNEAVSGSVCSLDGATPVSCSSPLTLNDLGAPSGVNDGMHTITVKSTDIAGNVELTVASVSWRQDTVDPVVSYTSKPGAFTPLGDVDFGWTVKDGNPSVLAPEVEAECAFDPVDPDAIDGSEWISCDREATIDEADNLNGPHTFSVRATDEAGNVSAIERHDWVVLGAKPNPPSIDDSSPADGVTTRVGTAYFAISHELEGTGALEGLFCSMDGGTRSLCDGNFSVEGLSDGPHTFSIVAKDIAGNISDPTEISWEVQRGAPVTSINFGPNGATNADTANFQFSSNKAGTFECKLDDGAWEVCATPAEYINLEDGQHAFRVRAVSSVAPVGVKDPTPPVREWTVDTVAPEVTIDSGPEGNVISYSASHTFSSNDPEADFQCQLNDGLFNSCTSPFTLNGLSVGQQTLTVRAIDAAGNISATPDTNTWVVEAPTCADGFEGTPPNCTAIPPVTGPGMKAKLTGGELSLASLGAVELPADQVTMNGVRATDGKWFVPKEGVEFQTVVQTIEDVLGPGTVVTVEISISATGAGRGTLPTGGGDATFKLPVRADVQAKLGSLSLIAPGTECALRPVVFDLTGTYDEAGKAVTLNSPSISFPKITGCDTFKTTIDTLLELPRNDISMTLDFALEEEAAPVCPEGQTGTFPDCVEPPVLTPALAKPTAKISKKKVKSGKPVTITSRVTNTGTGDASNVKVCLSLKKFKKLAKGKAKRCKTVATIAAGKTGVAKFTVKTKKSKAKKAKLNFSISASAGSVKSPAYRGHVTVLK